MSGDQYLTFIDVMQVFKALKRYQGLLCRPAIAAALQDELLAVVQQIDQYLDSIQSSFEQRAQVCPHDEYVALGIVTLSTVFAHRFAMPMCNAAHPCCCVTG